MKVVTVNNVSIKLGQNAEENTKLVKSSLPKYFWIHLESFPSGHVIVETDVYDEDTIRQACILCLENSKYRRLKHVCFSVTRVENLTPIDVPGEVEFKSQRKTQTKKIT